MSEVLIIHGGANKIRAKAAALFVAQNFEKFDAIIFSGGKTAGPEKPSEAENMKEIFLARIQLLVPNVNTSVLIQRIMLEEDSCDTEDNTSKVKMNNLTTPDDKLTLLSSFSHLPRIGSIYRRIGLSNISTISAEGILWNTGKNGYQKYLRKFFTSFHFLKPGILEVPLFFLTQFSFGRQWIRSKTASRIKK